MTYSPTVRDEHHEKCGQYAWQTKGKVMAQKLRHGGAPRSAADSSGSRSMRCRPAERGSATRRKGIQT